jgi:molybdopterin synthase catalytic subunit
MNVQVQFYAQLRDVAGKSETSVELPPNSTVQDLLEHIYHETPALRAHDKTILIGSGVEFVDRGHIVQNGDTISVMPPVQGG